MPSIGKRRPLPFPRLGQSQARFGGPSSPQEQTFGDVAVLRPRSDSASPRASLLQGGERGPRRGPHESGAAAGGRPRLRADRVTRATARRGTEGKALRSGTSDRTRARPRLAYGENGEPLLPLGVGRATAPRSAPERASFDYDLRSDETTR